MGKKSKTQTPQPIDTTALGQKQADENQRIYDVNLAASRPTQSNPFGTLGWSKDDAGNWTQSVNLSPEQQAMFNQAQSHVGGMLGNIDTSQIKLNNDLPQIGQYNQQAADLFNQLAAPQLERQRAAKEAQMAAMGLGLGSGRAYNTQQELLNDSENRSAMMGAQAGIQQGNTMFGQGLQLNQQGNQNVLNERSANLGQLSGMLGLQNTIGSPQFQSIGSVPQLSGVNYTDLANQQYNQQLNASNAANADKAAKNQATTSALGTVATIGMMAF